jgi:hypothetical protein
MAVLPRIPRFQTACAGAVALALLAFIAAPAGANTSREGESFDPMDMARGITMTQAQCAALPTAVWVRAMGRDFCIRYYISTAGGEGRRPVVFLQGDKSWRYDSRAQSFVVPPNTKRYSAANFMKMADGFSKAAGTTAIYLARPGVDGSSGHHRIRHSVLELEVTNAALEAIKRRHNFTGFHLVGQSGGATLVGGLLPLRRDIGCAVPGAGRLAQLRDRRPPADPSRRIFEVLDGIPAIVRNSNARILVITDPQDSTVPFPHQATFVQQLRAAGGRVEHYMIEATDDHHHGTVPYSRPAVAACIRDIPQADIAANLARLVSERLAARARAQAHGQQRPSAAPATPQQPANPPASQ